MKTPIKNNQQSSKNKYDKLTPVSKIQLTSPQTGIRDKSKYKKLVLMTETHNTNEDTLRIQEEALLDKNNSFQMKQHSIKKKMLHHQRSVTQFEFEKFNKARLVEENFLGRMDNFLDDAVVSMGKSLLHKKGVRVCNVDLLKVKKHLDEENHKSFKNNNEIEKEITLMDIENKYAKEEVESLTNQVIQMKHQLEMFKIKSAFEISNLNIDKQNLQNQCDKVTKLIQQEEAAFEQQNDREQKKIMDLEYANKDKQALLNTLKSKDKYNKQQEHLKIKVIQKAQIDLYKLMNEQTKESQLKQQNSQRRYNSALRSQSSSRSKSNSKVNEL